MDCQPRLRRKSITFPLAFWSLPETKTVCGPGTRPGSTWLLSRIEKELLSKDLLPDLGRLLRNSPFPDGYEFGPNGV